MRRTVSGAREQRKALSRGDHAPTVEGLVVPGIAVKADAEIQEMIALADASTGASANPTAYSSQGGLLKSLKEHLANFLSNSPEFNVLLCNLLVNICSYPVKLDVLDGQFNSTTNFSDKTHRNLTLLHMILFDRPLHLQDVDLFSIISTLEQVHKRIEEYENDTSVSVLVSIARKDGDFKQLTIPTLKSSWLCAAFQQNRRLVFNIVIFKELLKSLVSLLSAKELVSDMLAAYEAASIEDT